jgi:DNA-binding response OmpR family regulator
VLQHMRASRRCGEALVLIVTSFDSNQDREAALELRADGYFRKPSGYDLYMELGDVVRQLLTRNSAASA